MIAALVALALVLPMPEPPPLAEIAVVADASTAPAVRLAPPPAEPTSLGSSVSAGGRCTGWEELLAAYSPGWDVARMSRIMYRESRCLPQVKNRHSSATGLLQVLASHCRWLTGEMGEPCSGARLRDAEYNVRAAAVLWAAQGYRAWSTS